MTRIKIRDVGDYSIYVSEGTGLSYLNFAFFLLMVGTGAITAAFGLLNPLSWGIIVGPMLIWGGMIFVWVAPFQRETYMISDTCRGLFNFDYIDKTGDDEKDNKEICRVAQKHEREIRAIIDREERLKKMAENCKELEAKS